MPGWEPFTGLSLFVVVLLLGLARLSQRAVEPDPALPAGSDTDPPRASAPRRDRPEEPPECGPSDERKPLAGPGAPMPGRSTDEQATPEGPPELSTGYLLANVALTQGLFGAVVAGGAVLFDIPPAALGLDAGLGWLAVAAGVGFGVVLWVANEASASLADAAGAGYDESVREMLAPDTYGGWALLLAVILPTIAVVEELIFRAALIGVPAAGFGLSPWLLAVGSTAAFALGHGAQGRVGIAVTGGLGFVLAAGYIVSGSLVVVVVAHYLVNALEFVVHEGVGADRAFG